MLRATLALLMSLSAGDSLQPNIGPGPASKGRLRSLASQLKTKDGHQQLLSSTPNSAHFGDLLGSSLTTDLSILMDNSNVSFTPIQRVALTANGNFQRILSSYHNRPVQVQILRNDRVREGLYEREVILSIDDTPCCLATSIVTCLTAAATNLIESANVGIGQLFQLLGDMPKFSLIEVGKSQHTIRRLYTLASDNVVCYIEETLPLHLFDIDYLDSEDPDFRDIIAAILRDSPAS